MFHFKYKTKNLLVTSVLVLLKIDNKYMKHRLFTHSKLLRLLDLIGLNYTSTHKINVPFNLENQNGLLIGLIVHHIVFLIF